MLHIYCLSLENNKYYIGKTENIKFRLEDHFTSNGSEWTCIHTPLSLHKIWYDCDDFDEDKYTKIMMSKFGIENVRGGSYSQIILPKHITDILQNEIRGAENKCYRCGNPDHFVKDCPLKSHKKIITCYKCGNTGHYANRCFKQSLLHEDTDDSESCCSIS